MQILPTPAAARRWVGGLRARGNRVGVVPTMGALHEGHLSLIRLSRQECDTTVATIFVNPTQFGPNEDFDKYPRTTEQDLQLLENEGADAVFLPETEAMYPQGFSTSVEPPEIASSLEGECRPDHFRGVATVVLKLLNSVPATHAFFGRKDYQQWKVIAAMTRDLNLGTEVIAGETIREPDGIALSSRNRYLSADERVRARRISEALFGVAELARADGADLATLQRTLRDELTREGGVDRLDYAVIVDAETLNPIDHLHRPAVALVAAHIGNTRLIDNLAIPADTE